MTTTHEQRSAMEETVTGLREIIQVQTRLLDQCLHCLVLHRDGVETLTAGEDEVFRVILPMIHMLGISGHSLLQLTNRTHFQVKDAYPIARGIIEGAVNVAYIMALGREMAEKARRHAEVKSYRDLSREWQVAGVKMTSGYAGEIPAEDRARLESMLPEFTTAKGHEKDWTNDSLKQRLAVASSAFPDTALIALNASAFNIYRHASEVVHASYFSAIYFWGITSPDRRTPKIEEDFMLTLLDHQFSVLVSAALAYTGLIECFASYTQQTELMRGVAAEVSRMRKLPAISEALKA